MHPEAVIGEVPRRHRGGLVVEVEWKTVRFAVEIVVVHEVQNLEVVGADLVDEDEVVAPKSIDEGVRLAEARPTARLAVYVNGGAVPHLTRDLDHLCLVQDPGLGLVHLVRAGRLLVHAQGRDQGRLLDVVLAHLPDRQFATTNSDRSRNHVFSLIQF